MVTRSLLYVRILTRLVGSFSLREFGMGRVVGDCIYNPSWGQVRGAMDKYPPYASIFAKLSYGESQMLDKAFYEEEVKRLTATFEQQVSLVLVEWPGGTRYSL